MGSGIVGRSDGAGALVGAGAISVSPAVSAAATSTAGLRTGSGRGMGFVRRFVLTIVLTRVGAVVRSIAETTRVGSKLFGAVVRSLAGADAAARSFWRSSGSVADFSLLVPQAPANTASERVATFTCFRMCTTSEMAPDCVVYACAKCIGCATALALQ
jgi:hypothetical protein